MTPEENALLARLDGYISDDRNRWYRLPRDYSNGTDICTESLFIGPPDYNDFNSLVPLAFDKCNIQISKSVYGAYIVSRADWESIFIDEDIKNAIQQALLAIAREKFSGADTSV